MDSIVIVDRDGRELDEAAIARLVDEAVERRVAVFTVSVERQVRRVIAKLRGRADEF